MATVTRSYTKTIARNGAGGIDAEIVQWTSIDSDDDGNAYENASFTDRSVQVSGTFGAAGSVSIRGSNDGTNYAVLTDPQGNALDFTAAKIEQISEATRYVKPVATAGDGTTDLTVTLMAVRRYR